MYDVRIIEIATKRVTNYFDVDRAWIDIADNALHPDLFTLEYWVTPVDADHHPDCGSKVACVCPEGTDLPHDDLGTYDEDCLACTDSERYDDHMHATSSTPAGKDADVDLAFGLGVFRDRPGLIVEFTADAVMSDDEEALWEQHNGGERY